MSQFVLEGIELADEDVKQVVVVVYEACIGPAQQLQERAGWQSGVGDIRGACPGLAKVPRDQPMVGVAFLGRSLLEESVLAVIGEKLQYVAPDPEHVIVAAGPPDTKRFWRVSSRREGPEQEAAEGEEVLAVEAGEVEMGHDLGDVRCRGLRGL